MFCSKEKVKNDCCFSWKQFSEKELKFKEQNVYKNYIPFLSFFSVRFHNFNIIIFRNLLSILNVSFTNGGYIQFPENKYFCISFCVFSVFFCSALLHHHKYQSERNICELRYRTNWKTQPLLYRKYEIQSIFLWGLHCIAMQRDKSIQKEKGCHFPLVS